ncbi:hypothetical protein FJQ54_09255 [Sandaracinobacter neustonicus]|uniref:Uncharacterized protein n=1 Tax=Sandaracinobacter neustonicus TaxID=1715348 RepID=A0A501XKJ5_9SPHN|nr:hypothetical protein [Sandaracinobacter neustonicus]TPE61076.1 hypothetical protein FJQ54_09255 [Sandaracinobacter neustonicus]
MSLSNSEALGCFAMAQGVMVLPALGDSYAGKSAATLAGLMLMLADGEDIRQTRRIALRAELEGLLGQTAAADEGWQAGTDRLMAALGAELARAEAADPACAAQLLDWLLRWTGNERLTIPAPPPADTDAAAA